MKTVEKLIVEEDDGATTTKSKRNDEMAQAPHYINDNLLNQSQSYIESTIEHQVEVTSPPVLGQSQKVPLSILVSE